MHFPEKFAHVAAGRIGFLLYQLTIRFEAMVASFSHLLDRFPHTGTIDQIQSRTCHSGLVGNGSARISDASAQGAPCIVSIRKVGILPQQFCVILNGAAQVAYGFTQLCTVVARQGVVGFQLQHKVEILDSPIVIAQQGP